MREKTISLDFILVFLCVLHIVPWNFYWEYSHGVAFAEAASLLHLFHRSKGSCQINFTCEGNRDTVIGRRRIKQLLRLLSTDLAII